MEINKCINGKLGMAIYIASKHLPTKCFQIIRGKEQLYSRHLLTQVIKPGWTSCGIFDSTKLLM